MATMTWTSDRIVAALRARYGREAALVEQVANSTGSGASRFLDVLAVGLWPSRGLYLHGIEVKVTRSDLTRELALPEKAEALARFCDRFFIAIPESLRWEDTPIPEGWGVYTVSDKHVVTTARPGAVIEAQQPNRAFIAAVARRLVEQHGEAGRTRQLREDAYRQASAECDERYAERLADAQRAVQAVQLELYDLRRALGTFNPTVVRRTITVVRALHGHAGALNSLRTQARELMRHADELEGLARSIVPGVDARGEEDEGDGDA